VTIANRIEQSVWRQHAWHNRIQTLLLLLLMGAFLALLGWLLWGIDGILMLLITGSVGMLVNPSFSPWLVMRLYRAQPIARNRLPALSNAVASLSARAGLAREPELYYVPSPMLNAFAVGSRKRSAIALTDGMLRQLDLRELVGVMAHEISHIRNNDLRVMGLADLFSRATGMLSLIGQFLLLLNLPLIMLAGATINWWAIALLIFAPSLAALAQLALSRTREFDADLNAARLTGDPDGLAGALRRLEQVQGGWLERIFMPGRREPQPSILRTHPDTDERIARLQALKPELQNESQLAGAGQAFDPRGSLGEGAPRGPRGPHNSGGVFVW
jgi:heat shock protein HtpX